MAKWKLWEKTLLVIFLFPIISTSLAAGVAHSFNCGLDEGSVHQCMILGNDWGGILYNMGLSFWLEC